MKKTINKRTWLMIWLIAFAGQICWAIENNTFATYATTITGSALVVTLMVDFSALFTMIAVFIAGTLGDRLGRRRKIISIGLILWGLTTILFGFADFIPKNNLTLLGFYLVFMDSVMSFFGAVGYSGGYMPWTTDISDESNRGTIATIIAVVTIVANIVVQGLQGAIIENYGFLPIFVVVGISIMIFGVLAYILLRDPEDLAPNRSGDSFWAQVMQAFNFKETFSNKTLLWVLLVICVYTCGFNIYMSYSTSYLYYYFPEFSGLELSKTNASLIMGIGMLVAAGLSFLAMKPINRGKAPQVTLISVIVSVIANILLAFSKNIPMLFIFIMLSALGYIINLEATTAWFKNLAPEGKTGNIEGVRQIFYNLIPMCVGSLLGLIVIKAVKVVREFDGVSIEVPTNAIFLVAGIFTAFTLIPLYFAVKSVKDGKTGSEKT